MATTELEIPDVINYTSLSLYAHIWRSLMHGACSRDHMGAKAHVHDLAHFSPLGCLTGVILLYVLSI